MTGLKNNLKDLKIIEDLWNMYINMIYVLVMMNM